MALPERWSCKLFHPSEPMQLHTAPAELQTQVSHRLAFFHSNYCGIFTWLALFHRSQNQRVTEEGTSGDHPALLWGPQNKVAYSWVFRAGSSQSLNIFKGGDSTTSLDNLCQHLIIFKVSLNGISNISNCVHCLLCFHWAPLRRTWFCRLSFFPLGICYTHWSGSPQAFWRKRIFLLDFFFMPVPFSRIHLKFTTPVDPGIHS